MAVLFSPFGNQQFFDDAGNPATGWKIYTYASGSSTPLATYTTSAGTVAQSNPLILDSLGFPSVGQIWLTSGLSYKLVLTNASNVVKKTEDNITGVTGVSTVSQWQASGLTPTYVSATSFTLAGDQTSDFHLQRRLQSTNTSGTIYSTIIGTAYTTLTTITVANDSGVLDSGLSSVNYGLLTSTNTSIPASFLSTLLGATNARSYLSGCTLSTAGASATMSMAAGVANDSTNVFVMQLAAIAKTTSAWAVGTAAGGLDTGAIAISTWYHFYVIRRPDTGVVDVLCSLSATAPTLPTSYTQFRRIGSGRTNASSQWIKFSQNGDEFLWDVPAADINVSTLSTTAAPVTLTVPLGIKTYALLMGYVNNTVAGVQVSFFSPDVADTSPGAGNGNAMVPSAGGYGAVNVRVRTNTASSIRYISQTASTTVVATTSGWIDTRGRDA